MNFKLNASDIIQQQHIQNTKKIKIYKKVLQKCYNRIKFAAKKNAEWCFFNVPNYMVGVPLYDVNACIIYVIKQLHNGNFLVKYTHPNLIYISWHKPKQQTPSYKQIKYFNSKPQQTYKSIDEYKKPSGNFITPYDNKKIDDIDKKINFLFKD
tara:strand:+ start:536 stop:994 length:459 start_codon:yes stop_codon:yes gene_type:complete